MTFDDDLLSEEDLDNIENDNEGNNCVDESSSDNEEMNKILKIGKKRGRQAQWKDQYKNHLTENICQNEHFRRKLIFTNNNPQKNKKLYENLNSMRKKSLKFDVNSIYASRKIDSIIFCLIN